MEPTERKSPKLEVWVFKILGLNDDSGANSGGQERREHSERCKRREESEWRETEEKNEETEQIGRD